MSSVANSEESHRNSPDHAATSSVDNDGAVDAVVGGGSGIVRAGAGSGTGGGGGGGGGVMVVMVKRGTTDQPSSQQAASTTTPQPRQKSSHSASATSGVEQRPPAPSLPKQTAAVVIGSDVKDPLADPKTTPVETGNVALVASTETTTTTTTTSVSAPSQNNRRRNPLSQQSGEGIGGGGGGGGSDNVLPPQVSNNGHPVSPVGDRGLSRACCFCWCCCCSCSSLTVRNNEENSARTRDSNKLEILNGENEPPPTLEDIRAWGESFDRLMRCSAGRKVFRDFLRCEYSEENILFWLACEELKRETSAESVEEKARLIYEDYISILSPKEVSLDSRVREVINRNMVEPSPHTFDEAQLQIYTLMHRDSYPRFVNSPTYKKLAQMNTSSRKESSA